MEKKSTFDTLTGVDVSKKTEKKGSLSYLSWAHAWAYTKRLYPDLTRIVYEDINGHNYHNDGKTGWVKVGVSIDDVEYIDYLPIMTTMGRPKSIPLDQITSFEVNTAIQRSTTKALALHGLGLSIYAGEDLEDTAPDIKAKSNGKAAPKIIKLDIGDDNWKKVLTYVANNKEQGLAKIAKSLSVKYKITAPIKKELQKVIKS
jgi:hypothetical protein